MTFAQECVIPVERERLWDFLMEFPRVALCVPGVETIEAVDASAFRGTLRVQVGPIRLALQGTMTVEEQDRSAWRARMRAEANDRRMGGGIRARMSLTLAPGQGGTRVHIETDLAVLGKIGEFGQPVIKRKADTLLAEFARNLQSALAA
ncbi:MAG TPA: SRPBCC family protein [Candidatus Binatia bacterium]|nr:SRPBCC family protein [Candidatus Binatia bacterium]